MKAYPFTHRHPTTGVTTSSEGMDLRDYFAGLAMQEIYQRVETGGFERVAKLSYEMADAMMKIRSKQDE
jgi:hypothetical protein